MHGLIPIARYQLSSNSLKRAVLPNVTNMSEFLLYVIHFPPAFFPGPIALPPTPIGIQIPFMSRSVDPIISTFKRAAIFLPHGGHTFPNVAPALLEAIDCSLPISSETIAIELSNALIVDL